MNNNLNIFLDELSADAVIPTTTTAVKIRPITVKQIKDVVDNTLALPYFDIGFRQGAMSVFEANTTFNDGDETSITEFDFNLLFPYLKYDGTYEDVPVRSFLEKPLNILELELKKEVKYKDFVFHFASPSLDILRQHQDYLISKLDINDEQQLENEQEVSTIYYITELSKYVKSIIHNDTDILLNQPIANRLEVIGNVPYQVASQVLEFSDKLDKYVLSQLQYQDKTLSLDMSFFS